MVKVYFKETIRKFMSKNSHFSLLKLNSYKMYVLDNWNLFWKQTTDKLKLYKHNEKPLESESRHIGNGLFLRKKLKFLEYKMLYIIVRLEEWKTHKFLRTICYVTWRMVVYTSINKHVLISNFVIKECYLTNHTLTLNQIVYATVWVHL